jgi:CpeT/CpcT family (DUF1001)
MKMKGYAMQRLISGLRLAVLTFTAGCLSACSPASPDQAALKLVEQWVNGRYNNIAQAEADIAAQLPPEQMHRPMHQLFVPVEVPGIDGYIVYQQSSLDGSENPAMIFRHGLLQYFIDTDNKVLRQRELYFKETDKYKNAQRNPEILRNLTLADLTWDEGCDFHLTANADNTLVSGPIVERACVLFNQGLQQNMYADDWVEITANEYRFRGRYVDADGNVMWGTNSGELNRLVRQ